jgi:hypothetical protein
MDGARFGPSTLRPSGRTRILSYLERGDLVSLDAAVSGGFPILRRIAGNSSDRHVDHQIVFGFSCESARRWSTFSSGIAWTWKKAMRSRREIPAGPRPARHRSDPPALRGPHRRSRARLTTPQTPAIRTSLDRCAGENVSN